MSARDKGEKSEKGDKAEKGGGDRNGRSRRGSRADALSDAGTGATSEKDVNSRPTSGRDPDLVDVTPSKSFSRRCVIPTFILAVLFSLGLGAAVFFLVYYILILMNYCPWTKLETGCYQFFQDNRDWYSAQAICQQRGGRLAELAGFDKQTDVVSLFSFGGHSPACFWVGGFESNSATMMYTWNVSAAVMSQYFTEWESGYPKNRSEPTCVDFCHPDFSWKNKKCSLKQNYLCEFG